MHLPLTPLSFMDRAVALYGAKLAVVDGERRLSYAEFGERAQRLAAALTDRIEPGARVAVLAPNGHPLLEAYFGVLGAGGILLPLNVRLHPNELARIVDHAEPTILLADDGLTDTVEAVRAAMKVRPTVLWCGRGASDRTEGSYEALLAAAEPRGWPRPAADENDVAELFYTSGTTGPPRGVMLTHRGLYLHALSVLIGFRAADRDVQLHSIALCHVNGWGTPQAITAAGGTHVMLRKFDACEALRLIEAERVTRLFAVPTMLIDLLEHPSLAGRDLSSLELVNMGGAPLSAELVRRAEAALGCQVFGGYGLTETGPIVTLATDKVTRTDEDEASRIRRQATAGMPLTGVELAIVDERGRQLPWDGHTTGEVVLRGNAVMKGYWNDPAATAEACRDGWFHTGDVATVDPEGYVLIVDRKKDLIISGGENVSSLEVERALAEHPAVLECAVFGVPDDRWGEVPRAAVVLRRGAKATPDELRAFCRDQLTHFKAPKEVEILPELPHGPTGKVQKNLLRAPHWRDRRRKV